MQDERLYHEVARQNIPGGFPGMGGFGPFMGPGFGFGGFHHFPGFGFPHFPGFGFHPFPWWFHQFPWWHRPWWGFPGAGPWTRDEE